LADPTQVIETGPDPLDDQALDTCTAAANGDLTIDTTATASIKGIWECVTPSTHSPGDAPQAADHTRAEYRPVIGSERSRMPTGLNGVRTGQGSPNETG